jgi:uncharacterized Fe-S cluster protein YjdI
MVMMMMMMMMILMMMMMMMMMMIVKVNCRVCSMALCCVQGAVLDFRRFRKNYFDSENAQALAILVVTRYPRKRRRRSAIEIPEAPEFCGGLWDGKAEISKFLRHAMEIRCLSRKKIRLFRHAIVFLGGVTK